MGRSKPLLATRGCPFQCTFCSNPGMWTQRWIPREPRLVADEMELYVFDPTSSKQLADCLRRVLQGPGLARRLGRAGRALVVEMYDLGPLVEREITLLHDVARTGS